MRNAQRTCCWIRDDQRHGRWRLWWARLNPDDWKRHWDDRRGSDRTSSEWRKSSDGSYGTDCFDSFPARRAVRVESWNVINPMIRTRNELQAIAEESVDWCWAPQRCPVPGTYTPRGRPSISQKVDKLLNQDDRMRLTSLWSHCQISKVGVFKYEIVSSESWYWTEL